MTVAVSPVGMTQRSIRSSFGLALRRRNPGPEKPNDVEARRHHDLRCHRGSRLSETARRLRLSKSVVSDRLTELEHGLGATLLHRSARRLTLTEDGTAFLERATRITVRLRKPRPIWPSGAARWPGRC